MSTWTFRRSLLFLCLGLLTAACQKGGGLFGSNPDRAVDNPRRDVALLQAELADGGLTLAPPRGYCVDKRSLQPRFAIVARCDSLGSRRARPDAPLGMILVSVSTPSELPADLDTTLSGLTPPGAEVLGRRSTEPLALIHLAGPTPDGADPRHWRGLARVGPHLLGLTAYGPTGGELAGDAGGRVLDLLARQTREASETAVDAAQDAPDQRGFGAVLGGLFD